MSKKALYAIIGPAGCGKGTQCGLLQVRRGVQHVVMSDLLIARISRGDSIADYIKKTMNSGKLVTDGVVIGILRDHIAKTESMEFTLDGYPRSVNQARFLIDELSDEYDIHPVLFDVSDEVCISQAANRAKLANEEAVRQRALGMRPLQVRSDDDAKVHLERLKIYRGIESAIVDYFNSALPGRLRIMSGSGGIEEVHSRFVSVLPDILQNQ